MHEYRKSALALYQLGDKDRQWLLTRLPAAHRLPLVTLLRELETLGIPRDGYDAASIGSGDNSSAPLISEDVQLVDAASAAEIAKLLRGESAPVVAAVLSLHGWQWRSDFLRQNAAPQRRLIAMSIEAGRRNGVSAHLGQALSASLAQMLRQMRRRRTEADREQRAVVYKARPGVLNRAWRMLWPA